MLANDGEARDRMPILYIPLLQESSQCVEAAHSLSLLKIDAC